MGEKYIVSKYLAEMGLAPIDARACCSFKFGDNDVVLSGNAAGLVMLADVLVNVALAGFDGYHWHLDKNFFDETDAELIVELRGQHGET